jgi:hypothetical protein
VRRRGAGAGGSIRFNTTNMNPTISNITNSSGVGGVVANAQVVATSTDIRNLPILESYNKTVEISYYLKKLQRHFALSGIATNKVTLFLQYMGQEVEEELSAKQFTGTDDQRFQAMIDHLLNLYRKPGESDYQRRLGFERNK